jgi:hypothetical protein
MQVIAHNDPAQAQARKLVDAVLVAIGLFLLIRFGVSCAIRPRRAPHEGTAEKLLLAPALTVAFVPFLVAVAWLARREMDNLRKRGLPKRWPISGSATISSSETA